MKKALLILILVLSVQTVFAKNYFGCYGSYLHSKGIMAGGIVMLAVSSVPMIILNAGIISDMTSGELVFTGTCYTPALSALYISCFQLALSGSLLLYLGVKRHYAGTNNYYGTEGQMMRNVGIAILSTAVVPTAITGLVSAFFAYNNHFFTFWAVIDGFFTLAQLATGAVFLGMGIRRIQSDKMLFPEISLTHDDKKGFNEGYGVSFGMRMRI